MITPQYRRWWTVLGVVNLACLAFYAVLSYGLTPIIPFGVPQPREAEVFAQLGRQLSFLGSNVELFVTGQSVLRERGILLFLYCLPLVASTWVFISLLSQLARHRGTLDADAPRYLFRWAVAFAAISLISSPALVQDFWASVQWGKMVLAGLNPYYAAPVETVWRDVPLDWADLRMTYGPLWAIISSLVTWFAGGKAILAAALFKLLLAGAWIGSLRLISLLLRARSLHEQCVGIVLFGWLPLSVIQIVAEGHNDVLMVLGVLLWMWGLERGKSIAATFALTASILIKYVTVPLLLLDLLHLRYGQRRRYLDYLPAATASAMLLVAGFALFYRSGDFFSSLVLFQQRRFFSPADAIIGLQRLLGINLVFIAVGVRLFFVLLPFYYTLVYWRNPNRDQFCIATLAVMCAMLFGVLGYVWPWYLLWALAPAALLPGTRLTRWVIGVAVASPFPMLMWVTSDPSQGFNPRWVFDIPTLALYLFATLWFALLPSQWLASETSPHSEDSPLKRLKTSLTTIRALGLFH